jgi:hypothetical protein
MDRHLTYVAMTRRREGAALYAGRDEFAEAGQLARRLSRSGAKETTLDYARRRGIAERLGVRSEIEVPREVAPEAAQARAPERPRRGMFDGLRLGARAEGHTPEPAQAPPAALSPRPRDTLAERARALSPFEAAVERYGQRRISRWRARRPRGCRCWRGRRRRCVRRRRGLIRRGRSRLS